MVETSVSAWLSWTWMMSGWNAVMVRGRGDQARGSSPISQAAPRTLMPAAALRCASSLPCLVTSACSISTLRPSSRASSQTCCWPPRQSRPESTCRTRIAPALGGDFHDSGEDAAQCIEFEGLLEKRTAQLFEELQRVAAHGVASGEDDAIRHRRVHPSERLKHLTAPKPRHPQVANDQVERLQEGALQRLAPVVRHGDLVPPAFERRLHIVKDVRLVIYDEYPEGLGPFGASALRVDTGRVRT